VLAVHDAQTVNAAPHLITAERIPSQ
jgi:hypothetical protein